MYSDVECITQENNLKYFIFLNLFALFGASEVAVWYKYAKCANFKNHVLADIVLALQGNMLLLGLCSPPTHCHHGTLE